MPHHHPVAEPAARRTNSSGVTLVELMIGLAIVAIILAMAVPSFESTIAGNRVTSSTNDLLATLAQARTEAIRQGKRVTVCRSTNGTTCTTAATGWQTGWISFVDTTRSTSATAAASVDSGETILTRTAAVTGSLVILGNGDAANYVSFAADGTPRKINGTAYSADQVIRVCSTSNALANNARARDISLNAVGRVAADRAASVANTCPAAT